MTTATHHSLLPPSATAQERNIEATLTHCFDLPVTIANHWHVDDCPLHLLPWLAWALSVEGWDSTLPETHKRQLVKNAIEVHRHKGTVSSIKRVLQSAGFGDATVAEGIDAPLCDGSIHYDGEAHYGEQRHWASYRVYLKRPITIEQAQQVRTLLAVVQPVRCTLAGLYFKQALHTYNSSFYYDQTSTYGVVIA